MSGRRFPDAASDLTRARKLRHDARHTALGTFARWDEEMLDYAEYLATVAEATGDTALRDLAAEARHLAAACRLQNAALRERIAADDSAAREASHARYAALTNGGAHVHAG